MAKARGIDVSCYQGQIAWNLVASEGYQFAVIRATVGADYTDPRFYENWMGALDAGLLVSAYHAVKPNHPADSQLGRFMSVLGNRKANLPLVLDIELDESRSPSQITACVRECLRILEQASGRKPIIYTAAGFWNSNIIHSAEWAAYDLWVANYRPPDSQPILPQDWQSWKFWQYSDKGQVGGIIANTTDLNLFNGSYAELLDYAGALIPVEPPVDGGDGITPLSLALPRARVSVLGLKVRDGPGVNYSIIGELNPGDVVTVQALSGSDVWVEWEPGKWSAFVHGGIQYMTNHSASASAGLQVRVTATSVNVRSGPGIQYSYQGTLHHGSVVTVKAIGGDNVWVEWEPGKWSAFAHHGARYMVNVDGPEMGSFTLTRTLRLGDQGTDVQVLQETLGPHGYYTGTPDGHFDQATEDAVRALEARANIPIDGVVDYETCQALGWVFAPSDGRPVLDRLADLAQAEGAKELSWQGFHSKAEKYLRPLRQPMIDRGQLTPGEIRYEWCAAFVTWCCRSVGLDIPDAPDNYFATMALVASWKHWGEQKGYWHPVGTIAPRRGDIAVFDWPDVAPPIDHIGIVRAYSDGAPVIHTSEGNVSNRTANTVRDLSTVVGFVRITP